MKYSIIRTTLAVLTFSASLSFLSAQETQTDSTKKAELVKSETFIFDKKGSKYKVILKIFEEKSDSVESRFSEKPKKKEKTEMRDFWSGLDLGFTSYATDQGYTLDLDPIFSRFENNLGRSYYFGLNFFEVPIPLYRNNVALITGFGMDINSYRFANDVNAFGTPDSLMNYPARDYISNRLRTYYATIPLLLGIDIPTKHKKSIHAAFGAVAGGRFASSTREKYTENGRTYKIITRSDFGLNPFRINATARVGYGDFTIFMNYALTEMFRKSGNDITDNPQLYPFSFGIALGNS